MQKLKQLLKITEAFSLYFSVETVNIEDAQPSSSKNLENVI